MILGVPLLAFLTGPAMTLTSGTFVWPQLINEQLVLRTCLAVLFTRRDPLALLLTRVCLTLTWQALLLMLILRQLPIVTGLLHRETRQPPGTLGQKQPPCVNCDCGVTV